MPEREELVIRREAGQDRAAVRSIHESAFEGTDAADLVERLRGEGAVLLSLVAEAGKQPVGHILFSRMWIDDPGGSTAAVALAPLAVLRSHQGQGVGGRLIRRGLELLREGGEDIVLVLGRPAYYTRFGFSVEKAGRLKSLFPREAFMAIELRNGTPGALCGTVRYPDAFGL